MDATEECEDNPDHGKCRSSGAQCCSEYCHAECDAAAEETTCEPVCQTACSGSCEGGANVECQVQCQAQLFTDCETTTVQECNDECMTTGAAIFCDGQFLATSGDLKACADEIAAQFSIDLDLDVDVDVDVDVDCQGDACEGEGDLDADSDGRLSCGASIDPQGNHRWLAFGLLMLGLGLFPIRRRS
jgi:hypothetical protein